MTLTKTYRRRRHSVSLLHAHLGLRPFFGLKAPPEPSSASRNRLELCVKYRRKAISERAFGHLRRTMRQVAHILDAEIVAVQSDGDHLHLMILYPPDLALSRLVKRLKGASSRHLRQQKLPEVQKKLWGRHFWSPSYFVVSCGGAPLETVKAYVENQQDPHRKRPIRSTTPPNRKSYPPYPRIEIRGLRANPG